MRSDPTRRVRRYLSARHPDGTLRIGSESEPPPVPCIECGALVSWSWWDDPRIDPPRFMPPRGYDNAVRCPTCQARSDADAAEGEVLGRLKTWGVPFRYRLHRFHRWTELQRGESWPAFRQRVLASDPPVLGITGHNAAAFRALRDYRPVKGGPWVYVQGGVGTGKTLAAACMCRVLASVPHGFERVDNGTQRGAVRRTGYSGVTFVSEHALQQQARAHFARREHPDRDPVEKLRDVALLVLDDLGTSDGNDKWAARIAGVIDHRYTRELPTVITSNDALGNATIEKFGHRLHSRLMEACAGNVHVLDVRDWRALAADSARKRTTK